MLDRADSGRDDVTLDLGRNAHRWTTVVAVLGLLLAAGPARAVSFEVRVEEADGRPLVGAVVTLSAQDATRQPAPAVTAVIDQIDRTFVPDVVVIPVGSRVTFPNSDSISHQVYSFSPIRKFQLPLYRGKAHPPVQFDQPGVATLGCNIHDEMRAYVVVTDGQHYGRSDGRGVWRAPDVVPGEYTLRIWHPRLREPGGLTERVLRIGDAAATSLVVRAADALRPAPRAAKPATWDAY